MWTKTWMPGCVNQSAAVKAVKSDYTAEWRREVPSEARASCDGEQQQEQHVLSLFHVYSKREARADGPYWKGKVGAPEINSIWCPEDGWIPPQRHGVYEFREVFW